MNYFDILLAKKLSGGGVHPTPQIVDKTVTGNPLNFITQFAQLAKQTVISLEPIQDLHGYDYPWPGGGGKNKCPDQYALYTVSGSYAYFKLTSELYSMSFVEKDSSVDISGCYIGFMNNYPAEETTYKWIIYNGTVRQDVTNLQNDIYCDTLIFYPKNETVFNKIFSRFYVQVEKGEVTTFAPYSNICPISGRTETSLVGCAKNLFDISTARSGYVDENGEYVQYSGYTCSGYIRVNGNTSYIAQYNRLSTSPGRSVRIAWYDKNKTFIQRDGITDSTDVGIKSYTAISPANAKFAMVSMPSSDNAIEPLFMIGSQTTTYEPYTPSNDLTIQFGEKVYGAKVELEKGTVTVDMAIVDMGTLTWNKYSSETNVFRTSSLSQNKPASNNYKSSHYKTENYSTTTASMADMSVKGYSSDERIFVKDSRYYDLWNSGDMTAFTQAMSGQQLCYELATPRTITLAHHEISLLEGVNNISIDDVTGEITLTYKEIEFA